MNNSEGLEASVQYSTWKICSQISEKFEVTFSKDFVCTLGQLAFEQIGVLAQDLELFAKHAKRTVISGDDVKLLIRRIPNLCEHVDEICQKSNKVKKKEDKRKKVDIEASGPKDVNKATTSKLKKTAKKKSAPVDDVIVVDL